MPNLTGVVAIASRPTGGTRHPHFWDGTAIAVWQGFENRGRFGRVLRVDHRWLPPGALRRLARRVFTPSPYRGAPTTSACAPSTPPPPRSGPPTAPSPARCTRLAASTWNAAAPTGGCTFMLGPGGIWASDQLHNLIVGNQKPHPSVSWDAVVSPAVSGYRLQTRWQESDGAWPAWSSLPVSVTPTDNRVVRALAARTYQARVQAELPAEGAWSNWNRAVRDRRAPAARADRRCGGVHHRQSDGGEVVALPRRRQLQGLAHRPPASARHVPQPKTTPWCTSTRPRARS